MSNAKRRHRRRWRKARMWHEVVRAEAKLLAEGWELGGDNGVFRYWRRTGPPPDYVLRNHPGTVDVLYVEIIEVP